MNIVKAFGDFLLSEWLWSMTFAWSYLVAAVFTSWFFLRRIMALSLVRSGLLALAINIGSFIVYSLVVIGLFIHCLQWWYVPNEYQAVGPFLANTYLALIYMCLQGVCFYVTHRLLGLSLKRLLVATFLSNIGAAFISYYYIVVVFKNLV